MRLGGDKRFDRLLAEAGNNMLVVLKGKEQYSKPQKTESSEARRAVDSHDDRNNKPSEISDGYIVVGKKKIDCDDEILFNISRNRRSHILF